RAAGVARELARILAAAAAIERRLADARAPALAGAVADIRAQLARLVYPGFATAAGAARLGDLMRYLRGIEHRLDRVGGDLRRDAELTARINRLEEEYRRLLRTPPGAASAAELARIPWMIEELRISCFAQQLRAAHPVSEKRVQAALAELAAAR
ncbi:MAG: DUF3418 domain-containing protein, partial [Acidimicrobiales bacterium]